MGRVWPHTVRWEIISSHPGGCCGMLLWVLLGWPCLGPCGRLCFPYGARPAHPMGTRRWGRWGEQGCGFASPHKQCLWEGRVRKAWDHQLQMGQNNGMGKQPKKKSKKSSRMKMHVRGVGSSSWLLVIRQAAVLSSAQSHASPSPGLLKRTKTQ